MAYGLLISRDCPTTVSLLRHNRAVDLYLIPNFLPVARIQGLLYKEIILQMVCVCPVFSREAGCRRGDAVAFGYLVAVSRGSADGAGPVLASPILSSQYPAS